MTRSDDQGYYRARAAAARGMAQRAASPGIASIHAELAARYDALAAPDQRVDGATTAAQAA